MAFIDRDRKHEIARRANNRVIMRAGASVHDFSGEATLDAETRAALRERDDLVSLKERFRPDDLALHPDFEAVRIEHKWCSSWTIEARAFWAYREWAKEGRTVLAVFRSTNDDPHTGNSYAAWVAALPEPAEVVIPRRFDFVDQCEAMALLYPECCQRAIDKPERGSGTPFVALRKRDFMPLDSFIAVALLGLPDPAQPQLVMELG